MPYCSGCGSRYQEGDKVCKSCGYEIEVAEVGSRKASPTAIKKARTAGVGKKTAPKRKTESEPKPEAVVLPAEKTKVTPAETAPEISISTPGAPDKRQLQSEHIMHAASFNDIHLGKGIIKPKAVEIGVDGYHFKYEDQPHTSKRADNWIKEQSKEYRVVNPEFEPELAAPDFANNEMENPAVEIAEAVTGLNTSGVESLKSQLVNPESVEEMPDQQSVEENLEALLQEAIEAEMRDLALLEEPGVDELAEIKDLQPENELKSIVEMKADSGLIGDGFETKIAEPVLVEPEAGELGMENVLAEVVETAPLTETVEGCAEKDVSQTAPVQTEIPTESSVVSPKIAAPDLETPGQQSETISQPPKETLAQENLDPILWEGRQSWFGIPLPNQVRIMAHSLILTEQSGHQVTVEIGKIKQITVRQSWLSKFLGIGDLILDLTQQVPSRQTISGIANPVKVRLLLEELSNNRL